MANRKTPIKPTLNQWLIHRRQAMDEHYNIPERATKVFKMREEGMTLQAIGDVMNLTRERVRQIYEEHSQYIRLRESYLAEEKI